MDLVDYITLLNDLSLGEHLQILVDRQKWHLRYKTSISLKRNSLEPKLLRVYIHCISKKVPTFKLYVTLSNLNRFQHFALLESVRNLPQNPYDITNLTSGMLLHCLWKLKIKN